MSVSINIDKVVKKYGDTVVVNGLSVDIMPGEFFTLLGPSGCGKTTLLRMIIGFNSIEGGTISVDGNVINDVATDKRNMGMVFQNYAIFPHMSVKDNVAFGLRMRKVPEKEIEERSQYTHFQTGMASFYGGSWHGKKTANGEIFNENSLTAAHRTLPFGTRVRVTNLDNGKSVVVRINNRGPYSNGRIIDLSKAAFSRIASTSRGVTRVKLEVSK